MTWRPLKFTAALAAIGQGITVPAAQLLGKQPVTLHEGKTYRFSARRLDGTGLVLGIEHASRNAVQMQFNMPNGDRRIVRFNPDEFHYLQELP